MIQLPAKYNELTWVERRSAREQYIQEQDGLCMYCSESLEGEPPQRIQRKRITWRLFPPNFLRHPVHLQHDHKTGLTEGAIHARCNAVLWQYEGR